jgi:hypothetical protein
MSVVRRSACLAKKPAIPTVEHAQRNLCRNLGLQVDDTDPIESVLQDYLAMFRGGAASSCDRRLDGDFQAGRR